MSYSIFKEVPNGEPFPYFNYFMKPLNYISIHKTNLMGDKIIGDKYQPGHHNHINKCNKGWKGKRLLNFD